SGGCAKDVAPPPPPASDIFDQPAVKLRPSIAEETEGRAVLLRRREVERRHERARILASELGEDVATLVADEAVAVETLPAFAADPVGGDDGDDVGHRVTDHRPAPQPRGVELGIVRLGADCGR